MADIPNAPFLGKQGHITLESLLDSTGLISHSPLPESYNSSLADMNSVPAMKCCIPLSYYSDPNSYVTEQTPANLTESPFISGSQRQTLLLDICLELLNLLKEQDVNGYFLYPLPHSKSSCAFGLLDIEKHLFQKRYRSLSEFQKDIIELLNGALRFYQVESMAHNEAQRLLNLTTDWFNSLNANYVNGLNYPLDNGPPLDRKLLVETSYHSNNNGCLSRETHLNILNPDNNGIVSRTERVQSIGDEAGHLYSGSCLLPNGGYREDRRNKIIPYTYLDYGSYYSFAPVYDSGASHCTPESNQLLLGTTWLPARTPFVLGNRSLNSFDLTGCANDFEITDEIISTVLEIGDQQLAVSLAVAESEQRSLARLSSELEDIVPGPEVPDEFVFSMCLANAFTRDLIKEDKQSVVDPCSKDDSDESSVKSPGVSDSLATCDLDFAAQSNFIDSSARVHCGEQS
ncbi:Bromodomain-containing protein isoform 2 [Schistosoma japonicum]|nr:Bromodomain-containing protein isoform 2 [Schistosoma japonicum]